MTGVHIFKETFFFPQSTGESCKNQTSVEIFSGIYSTLHHQWSNMGQVNSWVDVGASSLTAYQEAGVGDSVTLLMSHSSNFVWAVIEQCIYTV